MYTFNDKIFESGFDFEGVHLVAASAGTGKTYNIQNIYARLVLEKKFRVSQILVMTFTEAATAELKERILLILVNLRKRLMGESLPDSEKERVEKLLTCAFPDWDKRGGDDSARKQLENVLNLSILEFDQASIYTIHGFCNRVIKRHSFEVGVNPAAEVLNNGMEVLRARIADWWRMHPEERKSLSLSTMVQFAEQLDEKRHVVVETPDKYRECDLERLLSELKKKTAALGQKSEEKEETEEKGKKEKKAKKEEKEEKADEKTLKNYVMLKIAEMIVNQYEAERRNRDYITYSDMIRLVSETLVDGTRKSMLVNSLRAEYKAALVDEFQDTDNEQYDIIRTLFLEEGAGKPPVFFVGDPKQAIYSFRGGDIFTYRKAVKTIPPENQYFLSKNFRSAKGLVDSVNLLFKDRSGMPTFQDEQIQYPVDIESDENKIPLFDMNEKADEVPFRIIKIKMDNEEETETEKKVEKESLEEIGCSVLAREVLNILNHYKIKGKGEKELRKVIPSDIAILVKKNDMAIPIRNALKEVSVPAVIANSGNVFGGRTISYGPNTKSHSLVSRMTEELFIVLEAVITPDSPRIKSSLITSFFGYNPEEILALSDDELAEKVLVFNELYRQWQKNGFSFFLKKLDMASYHNGLCFRERLARLPDGERCLADIQQITDLAFHAASESGGSPENLFDWLNSRILGLQNDTEYKADEYIRQLESESKSVQIVTIHKSKGLEYPVVILPIFESIVQKESSQDKLRFWHDPEDSYQLKCAVGSNDFSQAEERQEGIREWYVALTRASKKMVVITGVETEKPNEKPKKKAEQKASSPETTSPAESVEKSPCPIWDALYQNLQVNSSGCVSKPYQEVCYTVKEAEQAVGKYSAETEVCLEQGKLFDGTFSFAQTQCSYSSLSPSRQTNKMEGNEGKDNDNEDEIPQLPDIIDQHSIFQFPGGEKTGSCWHEILEKIAFDADDKAIQTLTDETLSICGFQPDVSLAENTSETSGSVIADMIKKTLDFKITAPNGNVFSLHEVKEADRLSEEEFSFSTRKARSNTSELAGIIRKYWQADETKAVFLETMEDWVRYIPKGSVKGFMDLIFRHGDYYYVVDWKSNSLGGDKDAFTREGVRMEMAKHGYFFQYLLYSAVLQSYLKNAMGKSYSWEKHFGGVRYYFLRGIAAADAANVKIAPVFEDRPSENLLDELAAAFGMENGL